MHILGAVSEFHFIHPLRLEKPTPPRLLPANGSTRPISLFIPPLLAALSIVCVSTIGQYTLYSRVRQCGMN